MTNFDTTRDSGGIPAKLAKQFAKFMQTLAEVGNNKHKKASLKEKNDIREWCKELYARNLYGIYVP